jgi:voltage-gated potassium channel
LHERLLHRVGSLVREHGPARYIHVVGASRDVSENAVADESEVDEDTGSSPYELFILGLSILSLVNFVVILLPIRNTTKAVLISVDAFMSIFFLIDFAQRFRRADDRRDYFFRRFGWLDLIGSLPFPAFRVFRVVRVVRVIRTMGARGPRYIWQDLTYNLAESAVLFVTLLVILAVELGSLAVLRVESGSPDANIRNASDALWWCMETITTVGYGDKYPVSNAGRIVGISLMVVGVALFGTFTAFVADRFVHPKRPLLPPGTDVTVADEIRALVREHEELSNQLMSRLETLESQLPRHRLPPPPPRRRGEPRSARAAARPPDPPV